MIFFILMINVLNCKFIQIPYLLQNRTMLDRCTEVTEHQLFGGPPGLNVTVT